MLFFVVCLLILINTQCSDVARTFVYFPSRNNSTDNVNLARVKEADENELFPKQCGLRRLGNRINGGSDSLLGAYPWMAIIGYKDSEDVARFVCGGSLITNWYVLTAAKCLLDDYGTPKEISFVRLGELHLLRDDDGAHPIDVGIAKMITYPLYMHDPQIRNDIGLILLKKRISFTHMISPICLPEGKYYVDPVPGMMATVAGWGSDGSDLLIPQLQDVSIPIVDMKTCQDLYEPFNVTLMSKYLCAAEPGQDSCSGDSGGPLMISKGPHFVVVGVLSFGSYLCDGEIPGVYSRVDTFVRWIKQQIRFGHIG